jgi:hypothetical protein
MEGNRNEMSTEVAPKIRELHARALKAQKGHYRAAEIYQRKHFTIGMITILAATIASVLTFFSNPTSIAALDYLGPLLGTVAAVGASVQTFSRHLERYDQHRVAAVKYGSLSRRLEKSHSSSEIDELLTE